MTSSSVPDVVIAGGGIGGLSAAFALSRKGLAVRVLEQAAAFGEVGAGIQLAPNCTRILHEYGLLDEARSLGVAPTAMVMRDAMTGAELTRIDLVDLERTYGFPYLVIHRSDLHGILVRACQDARVDLKTNQRVIDFSNTADGAQVELSNGRKEQAAVVIAADGLHSVARRLLVDDELVSSAYVAYRAAVPVQAVGRNVDPATVSVHVGPGCHLVQYGLRGGEVLNQVAVFRSRRALAGADEWGTSDELDVAFARTSPEVQAAILLMERERSWKMHDRDPIMTWVYGPIALLGDAAHPPLQYLAQGAIMAIEDGWVLAEHAERNRLAGGAVEWRTALQAYEVVRTEHCRRVVLTARRWGDLWHLDGNDRERRNELLRARDIHDYTFTEWIYSPTALIPDQEPEPFPAISLEARSAVAET